MFRKTAVLLILLIAAVTAPPVLAYPPCGDYEAPQNPEHFCRPALVWSDMRLAIRRGVTVALLYAQPDSTSPLLEAVTRTGGVDLTGISGPVWSGDAWWWEVRSVGSGVVGYTQQANVEVLPIAASDPIPIITDPSVQLENNWTMPFDAVLDKGTPFAWVRQGDHLSDVVYTLHPGDHFTVQPYPYFDGIQWWWQVEIATLTGVVTGMVEQGSITPARRTS